MANSSTFVRTRRRIGRLKNTFLPSKLPKASYTRRELDRTVAFHLMVHSEIENCVEDVVSDLVRRCHSAWRQNRTSSCILRALLAHFAATGKPGSGKSRQSFKSRADEATSWFLSMVKGNHGIKEANMMGLLLPIGIWEEDLDPVWLASLNQFGSARGGFAHQGVHTIVEPDPEDERRVVSDIVAGLAVLDAMLVGGRPR